MNSRFVLKTITIDSQYVLQKSWRHFTFGYVNNGDALNVSTAEFFNRIERIWDSLNARYISTILSKCSNFSCFDIM